MHQVALAEASIASGRDQGIAAQEIWNAEIYVLNWTVYIGSISETCLFVISASTLRALNKGHSPFQEVLAHP